MYRVSHSGTLNALVMGLAPLAIESAVRAQLATITEARAGETVQAVTSQLNGVATTSDGRIWALTHFNDGRQRGEYSQRIRLYGSSDNGKTWKLATTTRTVGSIRGSIATGTDGRTLHVVWRATNRNPGTGLYYAPYDTVGDRWKVGDRELLKGGFARIFSWIDPHLAVTARGTLIVSFYQSSLGTFPSWSGAMMYRKGTKWSAPKRVNVDDFGVHINAMTHGEDVHFAYRTNAGLYGIRYRRFDTVTETWGKEGEKQVSQRNTARVGTASTGNQIAVTPNGDTYVLYATGGRAVGQGALWIAYSKAGTYDFAQHIKVADDAPLRGGNYTYQHYSLSTSSDGRVFVVFSQSSENHAKLKLRWMIGPNLLPRTPVTLVSGVANQFAWVAGHRTSLGGHGVMAMIRDASVPGGRASFYSTRVGVTVFHGQGCNGGLRLRPKLGTSGSVPTIGTVLRLGLSDLPTSQPGIVFLGVDDRRLGSIPLPLDLKVVGMHGCLLSQSFLLTTGYAADVQGRASLALPLPNDPGIGGVPLYFQAFQVAPGANSRNALLSNGIAAIPR